MMPHKLLMLLLNPLAMMNRWLVMYLDLGGDAPPPPDYTPVANASKESAQIAADLGREQIAEGKRQYDQNMLVAKPVVDAQLDIMKQSLAQGNDYFDYLKTNARPIETALNTEAMAAGSEQKQTEAADRAVADVRQGTTASQNQIIRQGLRYGFTPGRLAATGGAMAASQGLAEATAANTAREKEKNLGFAKKLDVAGLYRGLPGASSGAYQVATGAGNSAVANNGAGGAAYLGALSSGANTTMQGRQVAMQGLTGVLNAQTNYANTVANSGGGAAGGLGSLLGGAASLYTAFGSHPAYKENITRVGDHPLGIGVYEFDYLEQYRDKWGHGRQRGVLATEVVQVLPEAVKVDKDGHIVVDYAMLVQ